MAKVFIAYSGKNMRMVIDLSNKLQETDHKVFVASRDIEGGKQWREEIQNRINSIDVFVPLISQEFLNSDEAKRELNHAIEIADMNKIKVVSVLIDDLSKEVIPYYIKDRQYIPYQTFEVQVEKLLLELNPQDAYLSSKEAFERHINSRNFTSEELLLLGQHALQTLWAEQNEGMGLIISRVFNLLRARKEKEKVLILYNEYLKKLPQRDSLWIGRSKIYFDLGKFKEADQDCEVVISRDPQNVIALLRKVEIRQAWALRATSNNEKQQILQGIRNCLDILNGLPVSTTPKYLAGYLRALAIGAELCKEPIYAGRAKELLINQQTEIEEEKNGGARKAVLKSLLILDRVYENAGETDTTKKLKTLAEKFENKWQMYHKRDY
jgi:hypothetical protein